MNHSNAVKYKGSLISSYCHILKGLLEAFQYGYWCPQSESRVPDNVDLSEDCLYLNIWRPRPVEQNRAVMVSGK